MSDMGAVVYASILLLKTIPLVCRFRRLMRDVPIVVSVWLNVYMILIMKVNH